MPARRRTPSLNLASSRGLAVSRRAALASLAVLPLAGAAFAQVPEAFPVGPVDQTLAEDEFRELRISAELRAWIDAYGRPTAKVMLGEFGPFDFLVDTGANTSVISMTRAIECGATFTGSGILHGTTGSADLPLAVVPEVSSGAVRKRRMRVAVMPDEAFSPEHGILGADVFIGRRLTFDILNKSVKVESSRRDNSLAPISNLRMRNGLLAELPGKIGKVKVKLMLDTGAESCIANLPLSRELARHHPSQKRLSRVRFSGVTGHVIEGEYVELPRTEIGGMELLGAGAIAADAPIFNLWNLDDEPAMIVGVDVLSRMAGFSIDYGARRFDGKPLALMADDGLAAQA